MLSGWGAWLLAAAAVLMASQASGAGQAVGVKHPVLAHGVDPAKAADYEAAVQSVVAMDEQELLSFVPPHGYATYCECPQCYGGVEGNYIFEWTIERPMELKCRHCGTVAYPNAKYPEGQELVGKNRLGEEIRLHYFYSEEKKVSHFFSAHLQMHRRRWLLAQCMALGKAYHATGKETYAGRVALVLDHIARLYPHYPVMRNLPRVFAFRESQEPPYPWDSGRWGYFYSEIPAEVIPCYDLIYDSKALDDLSRERGYDVRERIEKHFLKPAFDTVAARKEHIGNTVGYDIRTAALLGRVINEPRYVHWAFGWMKENVNAGFLYDGMWHEAPSYHYMTTDGLRYAFESVRGYSDPPGYLDPVDGARLDDLDPEREVPFWAKVLHAPEAIGFPNGWSAAVHDTHPYEKRAEPRSRTVSALLPGFGHASLGRGAGPNQMQAQLHLSGENGHGHYDNLNLTLWAKEREMLSDLGYTWTQLRHWATSTLGHNTVVVDRQDQKGRPSDGDLVCFFPGSGGVSVVEAEGQRGYGNVPGLDLYRRMLIVVPVSEANAYVVDIFRVRGGATHDWSLHGDAEEDTTATCTLPLGERRAMMLEPGEEWVEPTIEGAQYNPYGMLRDMRQAEAKGGFQVSFTYAPRSTRGLRVHLLPGGPAEVWLGKSPSVRHMGQGAFGDMRKAYDFWMPHLLVRRKGTVPLASTFAAVEEPYAGKPFLTRVTSLPLAPAAPGCVALQVRHGNATDTVISTLDAAPFPERVAANDVRLKGRLGLVRQVAGRAVAAWLFEGESLLGKGWRLGGRPSCYIGSIEAATRKADGQDADAFTTTAYLPAGTALRGVWMVVTHGNGFRHGYRIDRVERRQGKTAIVLAHDHGLRIGGEETREVFYPRGETKGMNTFTIPLSATMRYASRAP